MTYEGDMAINEDGSYDDVPGTAVAFVVVDDRMEDLARAELFVEINRIARRYRGRSQSPYNTDVSNQAFAFDMRSSEEARSFREAIAGIDGVLGVEIDGPGYPEMEDVIRQVGDVIAEEDTVGMVDRFNAAHPSPGVNNGIWWRMNSWREKMPPGYTASPCMDCGHPVAKPHTLSESVSCEFCTPPEIL